MGVKDVAARAGSLSQGIASTSRIASSCFNVSRQTLTNLEYETAGRYLSLMRRAAGGVRLVERGPLPRHGVLRLYSECR